MVVSPTTPLILTGVAIPSGHINTIILHTEFEKDVFLTFNMKKYPLALQYNM